MNLEVRELKQSLERRDAYILELEGKLALADAGGAVAYTDGHGMLWLPGERVTMSAKPIPLYAHPAPADTARVAELEAFVERLGTEYENVVAQLAIGAHDGSTFERIATLEQQLTESRERERRMADQLGDIGDYAHDHSTGPDVWGPLWEVRSMELLREAADALSRPAPAVQVPDGYRLQPHSEFDAMNAFIRGETKVPPGYALVPVEPTQEMAAAAVPFPEHLRIRHPDDATWEARMQAATAADQMVAAQTYRKMLAAAPTPEPVATEAVAQGGGVDVDKVMALVNEYGYARWEQGDNFAREGCRPASDECRIEAEAIRARIRALLASAPAVPAVPGWDKGRYHYTTLFNAIATAVIVHHGGSIGISVAAFEDAMQAATPSVDGEG